MKNRYNLQATTRQRLKTLRQIGKSLLLSAIVGIMGYEQIEQMRHDEAVRTYYFTAKEDNFYENPANWEPSYPGNKVEVDTRIVVQEVMYITGFDLELDGLLDVQMGATVMASHSDIILSSTGKIDNQGEIIVQNILNEGLIFNQLGAVINTRNLVSSESGSVQNLKSAQVIVIQNLTNEGHFLNYSYCAAGELFNHAEFQQVRGSELRIDGENIELVALYRP
ncbi:MAG: hypothetical protein AAFP02_18945 [Bacteroidota bacterium]